MVCVRRVERRATGEFLQVLGPAGVVVTIAGWMVDPVACASMTIGAPQVNLAALIDLSELVTRFGQSFRGSLAGVGRATLRAVWALGAPFIILGGIYGGIFSSTEAAAVACVYAIFVTRLVFRELSWRDILDAAGRTVLFSSQILVIVAAAGLFSWILTVTQTPQALVTWIASQEISAWQFLIAVNILLLVWGCFMDPLAAILLLTPVLIPIVDSLGIDKVHFGIVMTLNLAIGLFTPPFGINIFVAQTALRVRTVEVYRGLMPFLVIFLIVLLAVTFIPQIALFSMDLFMANP